MEVGGRAVPVVARAPRGPACACLAYPGWPGGGNVRGRAAGRGLGDRLAEVVDDEFFDRGPDVVLGAVISGVDYRLVDAAGNDLPFDGVSQGEVLLRGPWIIESYAKLADGTDRFLDGYWRSGDAGVIDKHGYLKITDRIKDVIKSGGEWISSIDMENAITSHPRIREAAVIGVEHPT